MGQLRVAGRNECAAQPGCGAVSKQFWRGPTLLSAWRLALCAADAHQSSDRSEAKLFRAPF